MADDKYEHDRAPQPDRQRLDRIEDESEPAAVKNDRSPQEDAGTPGGTGGTGGTAHEQDD
ncbi:hypothetical protein [Sphingomonas sp.]|uniref:hypothetical protein n=1 Tax=Sphingomonas sp. TaxID=28214 RepID=UPI003B007AF1